MSTRITQLDNAIKSQVIDGDKVMSAITQYKGGTRIDGKLLHVTGQSLFDDNIITNKMLQANSIDATKLRVDSLSTISAYIGGTLRGGKLVGTEIENESGTFRVDNNGNITGSHINGGLITGATIRGVNIEGQSIYNAGYKVKSLDVRTYEVAHGDYTPIPPDGYSEEQCVFVPISYKISNGRPAMREGPNIDYYTRYSPSFPIYTSDDSKVGLMGARRAYVARTFSNDVSRNLKTGWIYVLVIARQ